MRSLSLPLPGRRTCLEWLQRRWLTVLYGLFVTAIFWHGAALRFSLPQTPLVDADSWGYLNPAFSKLTGGFFEHTFGRNFVYPSFVFVGLCAWGNFEVLAVAQHCLGLLTGVLLLLGWNVLVDCVQGSPRVRTLARFGGLVLLATYLDRRALIIMEHTIRPEAVFPFFIGWSCWLNFRALRTLLTTGGERGHGAGWCLAVNLVVTYVGWSLKPSMGLGAVAANGPLLLWPYLEKETARRKATLVGAAAMVITLGLWWPERVLARGDRMSRIFLPAMLFTIHADMIHEQIVDDLRRDDTAPYPREWLAAFNQALEPILAEAQATRNPEWLTLGFNADLLVYRHPVFEPFFPPGQEAAEAAFCLHYYGRTWLHRPAEMLAKVFRQLRLVYRFRGFSGHRRSRNADDHTAQTRQSMASDYQKSLKEAGSAMLYPRFMQSLYGAAYLRRLAELGRTKAEAWQDPWVGHLNDLLDVLNAPLLIVGGLAGALLLRRNRETNAALVAGAALCAVVNFAMFLTIALAHGLGFARYVENQRLLTVLTEFAAILLFVQWVAGGDQRVFDARQAEAEDALR